MRIGTRGSPLALAQAQLVASEIGQAEIITITSSGDRDQTGADLDKSRWVKELEAALLKEQIDLAVHSAKDLPIEITSGLSLLGSPARAAPEDVLCSAFKLEDLPTGAHVGTSSIRRTAQLRAAREDLKIVQIRGNVDTRLRKLADDEQGLDAIVLARAGLERLGFQQKIRQVLDGPMFIPAPGQGALALQGRSEDANTCERVREITDPSTFACLLAERAIAGALDASCDTPLGAHAITLEADQLQLRAWVGSPDGATWISDQLDGERSRPEALAERMAERLRVLGVRQILSLARETQRS